MVEEEKDREEEDLPKEEKEVEKEEEKEEEEEAPLALSPLSPAVPDWGRSVLRGRLLGQTASSDLTALP